MPPKLLESRCESQEILFTSLRCLIYLTAVYDMISNHAQKDVNSKTVRNMYTIFASNTL